MRGRPVFILAALLAFSPWVTAQEPAEAPTAGAPEEQSSSNVSPQSEAPREDYYRAEFVILERKVDPADVNEKMASRVPEPPDPDITEILRAVDRNGVVETTRKLVSRDQLYLSSAANRLENSGRFRILLATGWYQSFPPNFEGEPLRVAIGDWLPDAGHREVEGHITIDRQRYLHVGVHLNHWEPLPDKEIMQASGTVDSQGDATVSADEEAEQTQDTLANIAEGGDIQGTNQPELSGEAWPKAQLVTWIRETRRMRSEEVHFLDSPTIGVLVFFKKIEQ
ncbi:peptidoglycan binding protein CsiV [Marinobacter sp. 71-i]|uniref:Peptidoglycan binding protein CsiV n=1 Tax=Marinobacter iranensis TaxID=2962607 RepID=A0ABT5Y605_9GAMM|nr:CsiV family protein [Marinobacter iranensis]MDF0749101.1 peptidoglycan binding protein CsiV [Marinobacter iranensis]